MGTVKGIGRALLAIILFTSASAATAIEPSEMPADALVGAKFQSDASLLSRGYRSRIWQGHANTGI